MVVTYHVLLVYFFKKITSLSQYGAFFRPQIAKHLQKTQGPEKLLLQRSLVMAPRKGVSIFDS